MYHLFLMFRHDMDHRAGSLGQMVSDALEARSSEEVLKIRDAALELAKLAEFVVSTRTPG